MIGRRWFGIEERDAEHVDAGLQAERTAMAWQRTALGVGGVSALLLHQSAEAVQAVPGAIGLVLTLVLLLLAEARYEQTVRLLVAGRSPVRPRLLLLVAAGTTLLALTALVLLLVDGLS